MKTPRILRFVKGKQQNLRKSIFAATRLQLLPTVKFFCVAVLFIMSSLFFCPTLVDAQLSENKEYEVKAAFIYNFPNFIDWPEQAFSSSSSPFVIGVLGKNPFAHNLDVLDGQKLAGRKISVRYFADARDVPGSHILFISESDGRKVREILASLDGLPVLTIGDHKGFCRSGGVINLVMVSKRVRFEVNPTAARKVGIRISSKLLSLASEIID